MTAFQILNVQSTLSLVAFALLARWHIAPRLSRAAVEDYLLPLAWVHVFRYAPLTLLVPGQGSPMVPADAANLIAYGDLASAVAATGTSINAKMADIPIGFNWYIVNFYVPALIITHAMMVYRLIRK